MLAMLQGCGPPVGYLFGDADVRDLGFEVQHAVAQVLQLLVFLQHSTGGREFDL
jgi:hypothetical protein